MRRCFAVTALVVAVLGCTGEKGAKGDAGPQGDAGRDGQSVTSSALPPGDPHCPSGGSQLVSASGTTWACNGAPGAQLPKALDGTGAELGTLAGVSMSWSTFVTKDPNNPTTVTGVFVTPTGQLISFLDAGGLLWTLGAGSGNFVLPAVTFYFESTDCSGAPLLRNQSPRVPVVFQPPGALQGVYLPADVVAAAPQSSWPVGTSACSAGAVLPNPAPQVTVYRSATRLADFPLAPRSAPITITP